MLGADISIANQIGETFTKTYAVVFSTITIVSTWAFIFIYSFYTLLKRIDL